MAIESLLGWASLDVPTLDGTIFNMTLPKGYPGGHMGFRYTGIRVRDMDRSIDFYTRVMGMEVKYRMNIREMRGHP